MSNENIHEIAEQFRKQCSDTVSDVLVRLKKYSDDSYQDATNAWLFLKLAEFEVRLREIENPKQ